MRRVLVAVAAVTLVGVIGCKKAEPRFEGPMPIQFGDCAGGSGVAWVSGPRPMPFTDEEAHGAVEAPVAAAEPDAAPERAEGQYRMAHTPDDPQLARQQAIEQARAAGIIGSTTLEQGGAFASLTGTGDISSGFDDTNIYGGLLGNEAGETGGFGFGRSGFGPGGGGTGWGTIGTGRYGTIGHGSGTGSGYGVRGGRGRTAAVPTVSIGAPAGTGDLDKALIRRYVKRNLSKIQYCYEKQLLANPKLEGTVAAQFFITENGTVASSTASGVDAQVAECVAGVIKEIEFPKPKGGGGVQVNYPFTFRRADDGAAPPAIASAPVEAPTPVDAKPPAPHAGPRTLFRTDAPPAGASHYKAGAANPLVADAAGLAECFRKSPKHYGVAVVTFFPKGDVSTEGVDDPLARNCVNAIARNLARPANGQQCSVAFGEMPAAALPALDVSGAAILFGGKALADDGKEPIIAAVKELVAARVKAVTAADAPTLASEGPLAVAPSDATPMKMVVRVVASALAGGGDPILAVHRGGALVTLPAVTLPVVPVPFGTGGHWLRVAGQSRGWGAGGDDERVNLSVLVAKDRIWIGVSRVNEFQEIAGGAGQADRLAAALTAQKASAFFADRADVEIAGDDDVAYGEVVKVIEVAAKAGFAEWALASPSGLSARPEK